MNVQTFPHLNLVQSFRGIAKLTGGSARDSRVEQNRADRSGYATKLKDQIYALTDRATAISLERRQLGLPGTTEKISFLLQIPDEDDGMIDFVAEKLGLEVVAEYAEGFLIVAGGAVDFAEVISYADKFVVSARGSASMAKIITLGSDPHSDYKVRLLLDDMTWNRWPFEDNRTFILDVSIETSGYGRPKRQRLPRRSSHARRLAVEAEFLRQQLEFAERWEVLRLQRESEIEVFVGHYGGEILHMVDNGQFVEFPDSFSARIKMSGQGFKDLVFNYPNLFGIEWPEDTRLLLSDFENTEKISDDNIEIISPEETQPTICIIDSGIQEGHQWLRNAIAIDASKCFIPDISNDDVSDYVRSGGHGTRVAGAALYANDVPNSGQHQASFWLLNARVLDADNFLVRKIYPPALIHAVVGYAIKERNVRIYIQSINGRRYCQLSRMSSWAAAIDFLSHEQEILVILSAGNIACNVGQPGNPGVVDHYQAGRHYPRYLTEPSARIANPAQSLHAITVGSIAIGFYSNGDRNSLAEENRPSGFSRSGFGLWDSIKPEVVEFGGDLICDNGNPPVFTIHSDVCPELVRSTKYGGPPVARDEVGTSFSAPKVAHIAGHLQALYPDRGSQLYRALIVNSARWPDWAADLDIAQRPAMIRSVGYGLPSLGLATENSSNRVTLVSDQEYEIRARDGYIFGVPIPETLRIPGASFNIRIDVTLAYTSSPKRTRKGRRGYLGVWLDWRSSKRNESFESFRSRVLKVENEGDEDPATNLQWILGNKMEKDGITDGVSRCNGTVQKDWTIVPSFEMPEVFGIVVRGHPGWERDDPEATAKFSLVVSFESLDVSIPVYEEIRQALQIEVQT